MFITVNPQSDEPLFAQVASAVRAEAATGALRPGDKLPAAREVAAALGMNLHTVLHAYQDLRDEGLIEMRRRRGAIITEAAAPLAELSDDISALVAKAKGLGLSAETLTSLVKEATR